MHGLSPNAATLLRSGRKAFRPSASDRDRVRKSLALTLGESAVTQGARQRAGTKATSTARLSLRSALFGGLPAVALGLGVLVASHRWSSTPSHASPVPMISASPIAPDVSTSLPPLSPAERAVVERHRPEPGGAARRARPEGVADVGRAIRPAARRRFPPGGGSPALEGRAGGE
jgi:hypothetical protein